MCVDCRTGLASASGQLKFSVGQIIKLPDSGHWCTHTIDTIETSTEIAASVQFQVVKNRLTINVNCPLHHFSLPPIFIFFPCEREVT